MGPNLDVPFLQKIFQKDLLRVFGKKHLKINNLLYIKNAS